MTRPDPKLLPSQHEAERRRQAEELRAQAEAAKKKRDRLRRAADAVLRTEDGRLLWGHVFDLCGYNKSSLAYFAAGDVAPMRTECNEAQRVVYLKLRELASPDLLARAEYQAEFGEGMPTSKMKEGGGSDGRK